MRNISCSYHAICGTLPYCLCHSRECTASHLPISLFEQQVPQLLWVATVAVIFGVSYVSLQGLQGPLASLDMSAHVLYRCARACSAQQPCLLQLCCMADSIVVHASLLDAPPTPACCHSTPMHIPHTSPPQTGPACQDVALPPHKQCTCL